MTILGRSGHAHWIGAKDAPNGAGRARERELGAERLGFQANPHSTRICD
jgi:hypothetical protein